MATESTEHPSAIVRSIPVVFRGNLEDMPTVYANHLLVSHSGPEFFLVFGVVTPPLVEAGEESRVAELEQVESLPVVKIAVTPESMITMARVIDTNLKRYLETKDLRQEGVLSGE